MSGMRIDVADLLAHPGSRRAVALEGVLGGMGGSAAEVTGPVRLDLTLERITSGIVARGEIGTRWRAQCSVCLGPVERDLQVHVDELFEDEPVDGETYPIEGHEIDLEQLVRDTVLVELPRAPHCEEPCEPADVAGTPPETAEPPVDERWAALSELNL